MLKAEILAWCHAFLGDFNKASRAYAKEHDIPVRAVVSQWKAILKSTTTVPQKGTKS